MKVHPSEAELFRAYRITDRLTDMTKLMVAFCNFANTSTNECSHTFTPLHSFMALSQTFVPSLYQTAPLYDTLSVTAVTVFTAIPLQLDPALSPATAPLLHAGIKL